MLWSRSTDAISSRYASRLGALEAVDGETLADVLEREAPVVPAAAPADAEDAAGRLGDGLDEREPEARRVLEDEAERGHDLAVGSHLLGEREAPSLLAHAGADPDRAVPGVCPALDDRVGRGAELERADRVRVARVALGVEADVELVVQPQGHELVHGREELQVRDRPAAAEVDPEPPVEVGPVDVPRPPPGGGRARGLRGRLAPGAGSPREGSVLPLPLDPLQALRLPLFERR